MSAVGVIFGAGACVGCALGCFATLLIAEIMTRWG